MEWENAAGLFCFSAPEIVFVDKSLIDCAMTDAQYKERIEMGKSLGRDMNCVGEVCIGKKNECVPPPGVSITAA